MQKHSLDVIQVKEPCPEPWDAMRGDQEIRFCGTCAKNVYNLSAMTSTRAAELLEEREGRLCVRFYRRADGTVSTVDCAPIRFAALRKAARRTLSAAAAMLVAVLGLVVGLGLLRMSGGDAARWLESTPLGQLAKWGEPQPMMGEPAYHPDELVGGATEIVEDPEVPEPEPQVD